MNISLDYDNTYTLDRLFWDRFIELVRLSGHKVTIVTLRENNLDWHEDFAFLKEKYDVDTIFCDGKAKQDVVDMQGIIIDVWIDDWVQGIISGSSYSELQLNEWRKEQLEKQYKLTL